MWWGCTWCVCHGSEWCRCGGWEGRGRFGCKILIVYLPVNYLSTFSLYIFEIVKKKKTFWSPGRDYLFTVAHRYHVLFRNISTWGLNSCICFKNDRTFYKSRPTKLPHSLLWFIYTRGIFLSASSFLSCVVRFTGWRRRKNCMYISG